MKKRKAKSETQAQQRSKLFDELKKEMLEFLALSPRDGLFAENGKDMEVSLPSVGIKIHLYKIPDNSEDGRIVLAVRSPTGVIRVKINPGRELYLTIEATLAELTRGAAVSISSLISRNHILRSFAPIPA